MAETIGILPLGRGTFDVDFAGQKLAAMIAALDRTGLPVRGPRQLLLEADETRAAIEELAGADIDRLVILQVTFTDAGSAVEAAQTIDTPLALWAVPEPRLGGRLRLNSFCGLNLASHALGLRQRDFGALYCDPAHPDIDRKLALLLQGGLVAEDIPSSNPVEATGSRGRDIVAALRGRRIARLGVRPDGFDTCDYDADEVHRLTGITVEAVELDTLFSVAEAAPREAVAGVGAKVESLLSGLDKVDPVQLHRSYGLKSALDRLRDEGAYDAFAIRCWPETFTEYGGAACGPVSLMGEERVPCACEADVHGALTQLILQAVAEAPVFLVDLVDLDEDDDTGVVWHCGQAPISMADPDTRARATIHTNRRMPLLFEFPLKPGRVTFARLSRARGMTKLVISGGEMIKRDAAFTGTSGVIRFDRPAGDMLTRVIGSRLEHHMALAYGDHRDALCQVAAALSLPVVDL